MTLGSKAFRITRIVLIVAAIEIAVGCAFQTKLLFPAEKIPAGESFSANKGGEEVSIKTEDGVLLNAIKYANFKSPRIILYLHGNAGSLASWRYAYNDLEYLRTDMIILDYRGYGKSGGKISEQGLYLDAKALYGYARELGYADSNMIVYGRSIGTGIAVDLAQGKPLAGLILESPYASLRGMIYREFWFLMPWFYLRYTFDSYAKMPKVSAPVLILHGTKDDVIQFQYGKRLSEAKRPGVTFAPIEGGGHNDLDGFPAKRQALEAFLGGMN